MDNDYSGFRTQLEHENKLITRRVRLEFWRNDVLKHYVSINGRDIEVPAPNNLSTTKRVGDAINPLHIKTV